MFTSRSLWLCAILMSSPVYRYVRYSLSEMHSWYLSYGSPLDHDASYLHGPRVPRKRIATDIEHMSCDPQGSIHGCRSREMLQSSCPHLDVLHSFPIREVHFVLAFTSLSSSSRCAHEDIFALPLAALIFFDHARLLQVRYIFSHSPHFHSFLIPPRIEPNPQPRYPPLTCKP